MNIKPWVQALHIDNNDFDLWSTEASQDENVTFWCLEHGKIPTAKYLEWAKQHYGLAVLKEDYFKTTPNHQLWKQIAQVANWSPAMLPIEEWDGVIFVACVEPPVDVHWSFPVQYVLAPPRALRQRWNALKSDATQTPPPMQEHSPVSETAPEPEVSSQKTEDALDWSNFTSPDAEDTSNANSDWAAETPDLPDENEGENGDYSGMAPEGINVDLFSKKRSVIDESSLMPPTEESEAPSAPSPIQEEESDFLSLSSEMNEQQDSEGISEAGTQLTKTEPLAPGADSHSPLTEHELSEPLTPEAPQPSSSAPSLKEAVIDTDRLAPQSLKSANSEEEVIAWIFNQLHQHFRTSMVLLFHEDRLQPWKWEPDWSPKSGEAIKAFPIEEPCLFRIVKRTKLPYHGHVVNSQMNDWFFKTWGFSSLPEHVTATPLRLENHHLLGVLLSVGEQQAHSPHALVLSERMADELVQALSKVSHNAA